MFVAAVGAVAVMGRLQAGTSLRRLIDTFATTISVAAGRSTDLPSPQGLQEGLSFIPEVLSSSTLPQVDSVGPVQCGLHSAPQ